MNEFLAGLTHKAPPPDGLTMALGLLLGLCLVYGPLWRATRNLITVAHEGGHALIALVCGRRLTSIRLRSDTSGVTVTRGNPGGLGMVFTLFAGYTAPAFMATGLAYLLSEGMVALTILLVTVLLGLMFLMIRNFWGLLIVTPLAAGFYYLGELTWVEGQTFVLTFLACFLTVGSFRPLVELQLQRMAGEGAGSDADQLQEITKIVPGTVWVFLFFAANLCFTAASTNLLLFR